MKKKLSTILMAVICLSMLLGGCGQKPTPELAQKYVQASLDVCYKGIYEPYMEITESTEEEAKALYEDVLDQNMEASDFEEGLLDSETLEQIRQLYADMLNNCKYTVENAQEDGDGFTVDVIVEPLLFDINAIGEEIMSAFSQLTPEEQMFYQENEDEQTKYTVTLMMDILSSKVTSPEYAEPATITVHIQPDSNNVLTIAEEDMLEIDNSLITM
ncbi:MAG: hypothetical protein HFH24_10220 [Ruminococcus sp.]|nr:hypothetical protein [Ruminococcus sp.]